MRMSPSCGCCGECIALFDAFDDGSLGDWEAEVGSWEDATAPGELRTGDSNGQIIFRNPGVVTPGQRWRIEVDINPGSYGSGATTKPSRLIFGWQSTTDYWYAEFQESCTAPPFSTCTYANRIVQVSSGTPTIRAEDTSVAGNSTAVVCYQDGVIQAYYLGNEGEAIAYDSMTTIGGEFGLGTGTLSNIVFVEYGFWELYIDTTDGNCDECP